MGELIKKKNNGVMRLTKSDIVVDVLDSTASNLPASARTVKVLKDIIGDETNLPNPTDTVINNISELSTNLVANNTPFRFGYDSVKGKYGYILNQGGADTVIPFNNMEAPEYIFNGNRSAINNYVFTDDYDVVYHFGFDAPQTPGGATHSNVSVIGEGDILFTSVGKTTASGLIFSIFKNIKAGSKISFDASSAYHSRHTLYGVRSN